MFNIVIDLPNEKQTIEIAKCFADCVSPPLLVGLQGEIGAGKTTFIRAMLKCLGVRGTIKSPTFSLVESYHLENLQIHHFDLYRVYDEMELEYIGFRDYFSKDAFCCVEWPERAMHYLGSIDVAITLVTKGAGREMRMQARSVSGQTVLRCLKRAL